MTLQKTFLAPVLVAALALVAIVGLATFAHADVGTSVTATVVNGSNATLTSGLVGTPLQANVVVASSSTTTIPTGTADFNLYAGTSCVGTPTTQTGVALGASGSAQSATTTLPLGGLSYTVRYSGDTNFTTVTSPCVSVAATQYAPTISLALSNTNVLAGSSVYASSALANASSTAGGTVAYHVYSDNACTLNAQNAGTMTVANGIVPNSNSLLFNTPGTYYFQAVYSGDSANAMATSSCVSAPLTVTATSTTPVTGPGTISGTVFNDLNKNDTQESGEPGLAGWTVWLHMAATTTGSWWNWNGQHGAGYNDPIVATATTDANGNYSFGNLAAGSYFVEEDQPTGWDQTSSDMQVSLISSNPSGTVDFANVQLSTTTNSGGGNGNGGSGNTGWGNGTTTGNGGGWNNGSTTGNGGNGNNNDNGHTGDQGGNKGNGNGDNNNNRGNNGGWGGVVSHVTSLFHGKGK